jgi:hypothetical protein
MKVFCSLHGSSCKYLLLIVGWLFDNSTLKVLVLILLNLQIVYLLICNFLCGFYINSSMMQDYKEYLLFIFIFFFSYLGLQSILSSFWNLDTCWRKDKRSSLEWRIVNPEKKKGVGKRVVLKERLTNIKSKPVLIRGLLIAMTNLWN